MSHIKQRVKDGILYTKIGKFETSQPMPKEVIHKSKVPGIHYVTFLIGSSRYLNVVHTQSGISVRNFNGGPCKGVKKLIEHLDTVLVLGNWDVSLEEVKTEVNEYVSRNLGIEYSITVSSYVVERWFVEKNVLDNIKERVKLMLA